MRAAQLWMYRTVGKPIMIWGRMLNPAHVSLFDGGLVHKIEGFYGFSIGGTFIGVMTFKRKQDA